MPPETILVVLLYCYYCIHQKENRLGSWWYRCYLPCITHLGPASSFLEKLTHSLQMVSNQHTIFFVTLHPRLERKQHMYRITGWLEREAGRSYWLMVVFSFNSSFSDSAIGRLMPPASHFPHPDVYVLISRINECVWLHGKGK